MIDIKVGDTASISAVSRCNLSLPVKKKNDKISRLHKVLTLPSRKAVCELNCARARDVHSTHAPSFKITAAEGEF